MTKANKTQYQVINAVKGKSFEVTADQDGLAKVIAKGFQTEKEAKDFIKAQRELGV